MTYTGDFLPPNGSASHLSTQQLTMALDGELPGAESPVVTAHLGACQECREQLDGLRHLSLEISVAHQRLEQSIGEGSESQHSVRSRVIEGGEVRPQTPGGTRPFGNSIRLVRSYISGYNKRNKLMSSPGLQPASNPGGNAAGSAASVPP